MSSSYKSRVADQRAVLSVEEDTHLQCAAHGCPLRWSVDFGERLCSAHNGHEPIEWPAITQRLKDAEAERAYRNQQGAVAPRAAPLTAEDKRAIGHRLRAALQGNAGKGWAERLREQEERGERITDVQRAMWRQALGRNAAPLQGETA